MKYLLALTLALSGCVSADQRINIRLKNSEPIPIKVVASCGPFSQTLILMPGQTWSGWVPASPGWGDVRVDVQQYLPQQ